MKDMGMWLNFVLFFFLSICSDVDEFGCDDFLEVFRFFMEMD